MHSFIIKFITIDYQLGVVAWLGRSSAPWDEPVVGVAMNRDEDVRHRADGLEEVTGGESLWLRERPRSTVSI